MGDEFGNWRFNVGTEDAGGGGAEEEAWWGGCGGCEGEVDHVLETGYVVFYEAGEARGEIDGPGGMDDDGCARG